jgi:hypothetical protein
MTDRAYLEYPASIDSVDIGGTTYAATLSQDFASKTLAVTALDISDNSYATDVMFSISQPFGTPPQDGNYIGAASITEFNGGVCVADSQTPVAGGDFSDLAAVVRCKSGSSWTTLPGRVRHGATGIVKSVSLASVPGILILGWVQSDGVQDNFYVAYFNGLTWSELGSPLNSGAIASQTSGRITTIGGRLFATWSESDASGTKLSVARWDTDATLWEPIGSTINSAPGRALVDARITPVDGKPTLAWVDRSEPPPIPADGDIHVSQFDGADWQAVGPAVDRTLAHGARSPYLTDRDGRPVVAWIESYPWTDEGGDERTGEQVRVALFQAGSGSWVEPVDSEQPINAIGDFGSMGPSILSTDVGLFTFWSELDGFPATRSSVSISKLNALEVPVPTTPPGAPAAPAPVGGGGSVSPLPVVTPSTLNLVGVFRKPKAGKRLYARFTKFALADLLGGVSRPTWRFAVTKSNGKIVRYSAKLRRVGKRYAVTSNKKLRFRGVGDIALEALSKGKVVGRADQP